LVQAAPPCIDQHVRLHQVAFARGQRIEPIGVGVDSAARKAGAAAQIGGIEHVANAKHPFGELNVAADLAAAGKAGRVRGDRSAGTAGLVDFGPGAADIAADVTAGLLRQRSHEARRRIKRSWISWRRKPHVRGRSLTGGERNGEQRQGLSHPFHPFRSADKGESRSPVM